MTKLAEQKALEAYPEHGGKRECYIKGYDKAMQDFEEWLQDCFYIHPHDSHVVHYESDKPLDSIDDLIEQFKNYIKDNE